MSDDPAPRFRLEVGAAALRQVVDVLGTLGPEVKLRFGPDGARCETVDPAHVAMMAVRLDRALFYSYECDRPGAIGVDVPRLAELLKIPRGETCYRSAPHKEAVFALTIPAGDRPVLRAELTTPTGAQIVRAMPSVDPAAITDPKVPAHEGTARAGGVDPETLYRMVKGGTSRDCLTLCRAKSGVVVALAGNEAGGSGEVPCDTLAGHGRAGYPAEYLAKFGTALKRADDLTLDWGKEYPLKLSFRFGPSDRPGLEGYYLLAARDIDDDGRESAPRYELDVSAWCGWAMRIRDPAAPDYSAARVDLVPTDVYDRELVRVRALDAAEISRYEKEAGEYVPAKAEYDRDLALYETRLAEFVADWRTTHKKDPARVTIGQRVGHRPTAPREPTRPELTEPFHERGEDPDWARHDVYRYDNETDAKYAARVARRLAERRAKDRAEARALRGHARSGADWAPARPKAPEPAPIPAFEFPVVSLEAPASDRWTRERKAALRAAGDPDGVLDEPEAPEPATTPEDAPAAPPAHPTSGGHMGAGAPEPKIGAGAACPECGGSGYVRSRRYTYSCPGCGPATVARIGRAAA